MNLLNHNDHQNRCHRLYRIMSLLILLTSSGLLHGQILIPEMIVIKAGSFKMGSVKGDADHRPVHTIEFKHQFAISRTEITFSQFDQFSRHSGRKLVEDQGWRRENMPVINVNFYDALAYTRWLSQKTGRKFRLPTEAEWEYAASAKVSAQQPVLGFKDLIGKGDANCSSCRYFWESDKPSIVGSYKANGYGLYDMLGNVWEWTCSVYSRSYQGNEKKCVHDNNLDGSTLVVRGGSWKSDDQILRTYIRMNQFPSYATDDLGFRIVEELQ